MKSIVKHYKKQPDGSLKFVGTEVVEYSRNDCPLQPDAPVILSERRSEGRRTIVLAEPPKRRGRPTDPLKVRLAGICAPNEIERKIAEMQYNGICDENDENVFDLFPEPFGQVEDPE